MKAMGYASNVVSISESDSIFEALMMWEETLDEFGENNSVQGISRFLLSACGFSLTERECKCIFNMHENYITAEEIFKYSIKISDYIRNKFWVMPLTMFLEAILIY